MGRKIETFSQQNKHKIGFGTVNFNYSNFICKMWAYQLQRSFYRVSEALHTTIHCQGIKYGNKKHWDSIWKLFEKETTPALKDNFLKALCCSRSTKILKRYLIYTHTLYGFKLKRLLHAILEKLNPFRTGTCNFLFLILELQAAQVEYRWAEIIGGIWLLGNPSLIFEQKSFQIIEVVFRD